MTLLYIYLVASYLIMLVVSFLLVSTTHNSSLEDKFMGILLFIFAPITLPLLIIKTIL